MVVDILSRLQAFSPMEALAEMAGGAIVMDCRESAAFGAAHLPGSLNVQFSNKRFAERVASLASHRIPLLLQAEGDAQAIAACAVLMDTSQALVKGYLAGGIPAWKSARLPIQITTQMSIHELQNQLSREDRNVTVLDVREPFEWEELGRIDGSVLISLGELQRRHGELCYGGALAIICEHGFRSSTAASVLERHGFEGIVNVVEGMAGWRKANYPVVPWIPEPSESAQRR